MLLWYKSIKKKIYVNDLVRYKINECMYIRKIGNVTENVSAAFKNTFAKSGKKIIITCFNNASECLD